MRVGLVWLRGQWGRKDFRVVGGRRDNREVMWGVGAGGA